MKPAAKNALILVLLAAVLAYTVHNYLTGGLDTGTFLVYMAILCLPLVNIANILFHQWRDR